MRYKPFHNQLAKHAFPTFTWHLFDLLLDHLVLRVLAPLPGHALRRFDDILLQDGSSFAVVDALQDTFPGRFTTVSPAAVELHATMSLFHDQAIHVHLAPDADGERQFLPAPGDLHRKLILADRGYMDIDYCRCTMPLLHRVSTPLSSARGSGGVSGCRGWETPGRCPRPSQGHDLLVSWTHAPALLLIWNRSMRAHMALVTNLPTRTSASIRELYRLRWQIELLFKEWKSCEPARLPDGQPLHCRGAHLGAFHAAEIVYVFDNLGRSPYPYANRSYDATDETLADTMADYWVRFAATGDPNGDGLSEWPVYTPDGHPTMVFGDTTGAGPHPAAAQIDFIDEYQAGRRAAFGEN